MTTQTAMAPAMMRPLAPAGPTSRASSSTPRTLQPSTSSGPRPLKPLLAASGSSKSSALPIIRPRPIALAPSKPATNTASASTSIPISPAVNASSSSSSSSISSSSASSSKTQTAVNAAPLQSTTPSMKREEERKSESVGSGCSTLTDSRQVSESPFDYQEETEGEEDELGLEGRKDPDHIQPKKEWILPARAKPGRKPSSTEPPTKRKAQNRASQRAFRERKQSYVASLEEKIEEYEKKRVGVSVELQKVARRLKEENEGLKIENGKLKERVQALEGVLASKSEHEGGEAKTRRPPLIERTPVRKRMPEAPMLGVNESPGAGTGVWTWNTTEASATRDTTEYHNGSKTIASMNRDCGFCTEQSPCLCSGEAVLDLTGDRDDSCLSPNSMTTATTTSPTIKREEEGNVAAVPSMIRTPSDTTQKLSSPSSIASTTSTTKQKLWYTVPSKMGPPLAPPVQSCPTTTERRIQFPFRLGQSSNILPPLQLNPRGLPKLWPVYSPVQTTFHQGDIGNMKDIGTVPVYRLRSASGASNITAAAPAVCSGDPSHCNACSTDPALAAFCKAVASHLAPDATGPTTPAILDAGNALPLRNNRKRSYSSTRLDNPHLPPPRPCLSSSSSSSSSSLLHSTGTPLGINLYTNNKSGTSMDTRRTSLRGNIPRNYSTQNQTLQSIPEAWNRIKRHPSFPKWQGGLEMLADVVSKRSSPAAATKTTATTTATQEPLTPRVDIEKNPSIAMKFHRKSNDRNAEPSSESVETATEDRDVKRRRLYVESESVEDALALLDRGYKTKDAMQSSKKENGCVCPLNRSL